MYKKDLKQVGTIIENVADTHQLYEYVGRPIMQSLDFYIHIAKHVKDFKSVDNYMSALQNISNVLTHPEFTYYDNERHTILYYGKTAENVCYVVKLNLGKEYCYLASLYPISERKLEKYKEKSYLRQEC